MKHLGSINADPDVPGLRNSETHKAVGGPDPWTTAGEKSLGERQRKKFQVTTKMNVEREREGGEDIRCGARVKKKRNKGEHKRA